jgi:hypothetical protein
MVISARGRDVDVSLIFGNDNYRWWQFGRPDEALVVDRLS